jgi:hypothetical protein
MSEDDLFGVLSSDFHRRKAVFGAYPGFKSGVSAHKMIVI